MDEMIRWLRAQSPMGLAKLFLIDVPMLIVRVWLRLYLYILAVGSLILWATLLIWLAQAAWQGL